MAKKGRKSHRKRIDRPKKRTREHVIASLSVNFVEGIVYEQGYAAERVQNDYGYDLTVTTFDRWGYVEPGVILLQLKATDTIKIVADGAEVSFGIDVADYLAWTAEAYPVFLIIFDAQARNAYWLYIQKYFSDGPDRAPATGAATVTIRIPVTQTLDASTIAYMREQKKKVMRQYVKVKHG
jgi:hypothetical protein